MKLNTAKSTVTTAHSLDVTKATIELNSTTIHVLSRDLYSRPVHAVLREILTNAIDAHIEAGVKTPVDVKIPTIWDEQFYIRDYGNGLDNETLKGIYLAYGKSTRRDSDNVHGGFGLGTKSPLAYTSAFSVTSYQNGIENVYIVYYDQDNMPCLDHKETKPTTEPNGLKVAFAAVNSSDYLLFREAANAVLPRIPPELYRLIDSDEDAWAIDGFKLPTGLSYGPLVLRNEAHKIYVVMGCVAYELDFDAVIKYLRNLGENQIFFHFDDAEYPADKVIHTLASKGSIEISAQIGDYPVHPSREYINITPRAIKRFCKDVQAGLTIMYDTVVKTNPTFKSDVVFFGVTGVVPSSRKDTPIRARLIQPSPYTYNPPRITRQWSSYHELVETASVSRRDFVVGVLSTDDFTDYLGNGRSTYKYPSFVDNDTAILFYDKQRSGDFMADLFREHTPLDFTQEVADWKLESENQRKVAQQRAAAAMRPRTVVRSMQDPKHNVLILEQSVGSMKRHWSSAQHNVESLKALKRPVFWTRTRMGCIEDSSNTRPILERFLDVRKFAPTYKCPIIIGLPASKGTLAFERAFPPLDELSAWMDDFVRSPATVRRVRLRRTAELIQNKVDTYRVAELCAYGHVDYLNRIVHMATKYRIPYAPILDDAANDSKEHDVSAIIEDVQIKFPVLRIRSFGWNYNVNVEQYKPWAAELARLISCHPTSAKYKNASPNPNPNP